MDCGDPRHLAVLMMSSVNLRGADEFAVGEALIRFKDSTAAQEIALFEKTEAFPSAVSEKGRLTIHELRPTGWS